MKLTPHPSRQLLRALRLTTSVFFAVAQLAACRGPIPNTQTFTSDVGTFVPTVLAAITTVSVTRSATQTPPPPTATASPTPTSKPSPKPTQTPNVNATATAYWAHFANVAQTVVAVGQRRVYDRFLSPDGRWRVEASVYDCVKVVPGEYADANAYEQLTLVDLSSGAETIFQDQLQFCGGIGAGGLGGLQWSPNSRYFYFTTARAGVPDGLCGYWARPIHRVAVNTQQVEYVGSGHFSPDGTKLAFWHEADLVVWDLNDGEMARLSGTIPTAFPNEIAWSPDSQALVYLQSASDCYPPGASYVTRVNLADSRQTLVIEAQSPSFVWLIWDAPNGLRLRDALGNTWRYNFSSQALWQVD